MNCFNLNKARTIYAKGGNVTQFLRSESGSEVNTSEIIEIAYDLQAGSYVKFLNENPEKLNAYTNELASLIAPYLSSDKSLLDIGTGELTTLSLLLSHVDVTPADVYAFDISWSRLHHGIRFWNETVNRDTINLHPFVADIKEIPLATNSIDVVTSSHALEPNGGNLPLLLKELFRVCREHLVLFEPSYELSSEKVKARMDRLGYIKNIEGVVEELGGVVREIIPIDNVINPLNPNACYVIEPPNKCFESSFHSRNDDVFAVPGSDFSLVEKEGFLVSTEVGLVFPILMGIPILKANSGILATSLS